MINPNLKSVMLPASQRQRQLAKSLIGTTFKPANFEGMVLQAKEAFAYHQLAPYPVFAFQDWKTEERGPLPKCLPIAKKIVTKSARWLFGKPIQIKCPENEKLETYFEKAWQKNRMYTRMVAAATKAGYEGGVVLKFSFDETAATPLAFDVLSAVDQTRLYFDPHDKDTLIMARVQYPYYDGATGKWYFFREDWTAEEVVSYKPVEAKQPHSSTPYAPWTVADGSVRGSDPDSHGKWEIDSTKKNGFGVIPMVLVRNIESDWACGEGDCWNLFRILDRINLTYHQMDKSNQLDSDPTKVFIDASVASDDIDRPLPPGGNIDIKSEEGEGKKADVKLLEPAGHMRPHVHEYARDLRGMLISAASSVELRQEDITNKGNLTSAVLSLIHAPLIEITNEKRKTYGEDGICKFLELCAVGLSNLKAKGFPSVDVKNEDSYNVDIVWAPYFELTPDEKAAEIERVQAETTAGFINHERAVTMVAKTEGITDVKALLEEAEAAKAEAEEKNGEGESDNGAGKPAVQASAEHREE